MNTEEKQIFELLKEVVDPELMVNIIDLGLIYGVTYNESEHKIGIDLTLTSPGCPMGGLIMEDAQQQIESCYPNFEVNINLVWEPMWSVENLTEAGKEALGQM
ncbi:MAG: metal-sulfur cluster assembly factor [Prolixibacteraceae bacterium]